MKKTNSEGLLQDFMANVDFNCGNYNQALLNAVSSAACVLNNDGSVVISNQEAKDLFDLYPGTTIELKIPDIWVAVETVLNNNKNRASFAFIHCNSNYLAEIGPIFWQSRVCGALCILKDVTEIEKIKLSLQSHQALNWELDAIITASMHGLWICDGNAKVLRINPASERINNIRSEDVVGRNMRDLEKEGFVDRSVTLQVIESGEKVNLIQRTRGKRKLILSGSPVFDDHGSIIRIVVTEQDITEIDQLRRDLEEQEAIREQFRHQLLEMQLSAFDSTPVIAESPCFIKVLKQALRVSRVDSTVLILGESGTGKGVVADLVHKHSDRADRPMLKLNCGAIPESLVESELFGYEKGAFTGASRKGKPGYIELAHEGILFLDEIGEMPLQAQVKLLRFLEDGYVYRIGGTMSKKVNVRVICATNKDLDAMVAAGKFRGDLYYRLNVIPLRIPPLRDRKECILPLLHHYIDHFIKKHHRTPSLRFSSDAVDALLSYGYPGNVRELINICERLVVMTDGHEINLYDLPKDIKGDEPSFTSVFSTDQAIGSMTLAQILSDTERKILKEAKQQLKTQAKIANTLGVNQSTIARKLRRYGI